MGKTHYHVLAGGHGYMPDYNGPCETLAAAKEDLRDYAERVFDDEEYPEDAIPNPWPEDTDYLEFEPGHGVDYVEISDPCSEDDCWDENGELVQD